MEDDGMIAYLLSQVSQPSTTLPVSSYDEYEGLFGSSDEEKPKEPMEPPKPISKKRKKKKEPSKLAKTKRLLGVYPSQEKTKKKGRPKSKEPSEAPVTKKAKKDTASSNTKNSTLNKIKKKHNKTLNSVLDSAQKIEDECKQQLETLEHNHSSLSERKGRAEKVVKELRDVAARLKKVPGKEHLVEELEAYRKRSDGIQSEILKVCNQCLSSLKVRQKDAMARNKKIQELIKKVEETQRSFIEQTNDIFAYPMDSPTVGVSQTNANESQSRSSDMSQPLLMQRHLPLDISVGSGKKASKVTGSHGFIVSPLDSYDICYKEIA